MRALIIPACLVVTACGGTVIQERVQPLNMPVRVACVDGERPNPPAALRERYTRAQWAALTPRQKAAIVGSQGLRRQTYGERLDAATKGCR